MVLWQSDLRVSWRAQWLSLLIHGLVAAVILLMPWPLSYTPLWMVLLSLVVFDCVRSQRRINARQGEIRLLMDGRLRWQGQEWCIVKAPWMIKSGMMLRLRSDGGKRQHLWLAASTAWTKPNGGIYGGFCCNKRRKDKDDGKAYALSRQ